MRAWRLCREKRYTVDNIFGWNPCAAIPPNVMNTPLRTRMPYRMLNIHAIAGVPGSRPDASQDAGAVIEKDRNVPHRGSEFRRRPFSGRRALKITTGVDFRAPNGERVRQSTETENKGQAQELHDKLKSETWRLQKLGDRPKRTWQDAVVR
jgi:hypothetical protein